MTKLLDKSGKIVDIPAGDVAAAVDSGRFSFPSGRNIPIIQNGQAKWVDPNFAADYYKSLTFTEDDIVAQQRAEDRTRGLGGLAAGLGYGVAKSATLGAAPLVIGAASDTARDYFRDLELGRSGAVATGEVAGLFVDPFAAAGKASQRAAAAKGAEQLAARDAAQEAMRANVSPSIGEGTAAALFGPATQTPAATAAQVAGEAAQVGRGAIEREVSPLLLGGQAATPTAEEAALLTAEAKARARSTRRGAIKQARNIVKDEAEQIIEEQSLRMRPLTGPTSPADTGLRLGMDPFRTEQMLMRGRQAEELASRAEGARLASQAAAERAAAERAREFPVVEPPDLSGFKPGDLQLPSAREAVLGAAKREPWEIAMEQETAAAKATMDEASREAARAEAEAMQWTDKSLADELQSKFPGESLDRAIGTPLTQLRGEAQLFAKQAKEAAAAQKQTGSIGLRGVRSGNLGRMNEAPLLDKELLGESAEGLELTFRPSEDFSSTAYKSIKDAERAMLDADRAAGRASQFDEVGLLDQLAQDADGAASRAFGPRTARIEWDQKAAKLAGVGKPQRGKPFWVVSIDGERVGDATTKTLAASRAFKELQNAHVGALEDLAARMSLAERSYIKNIESRAPGVAEGEAAAAAQAAGQASPQLSLADIQFPVGPSKAEMDASAAAARAFEGESARMATMASELDAANTVTPTLRTAQTRVLPENVSPRLGVPVPPAPSVSPMGLGMAETGVMPPARGLSLGAPIEAQAAMIGAGEQAVQGAQAAAPMQLGAAAQGAVYSGLSQAQRQQMGLEEGGPQEIALAAALGGALPLGLAALGKGFNGVAGQVAQSRGSDGLPLGQKFTRAMERLEETQLLRTFGLNKSQIQALIGQLKDDGVGRRGTRQFADFVKAEFARLEQLKADPRFVDNEALQSIKTDGFLKFGNMKPEQRVAFSDAVRTFYGQMIEKLYEPAAGVRISNDELSAALNAIRSQAMGSVKGLGDIPMKSIQAEFDAFRRFVDDPANTHTVASLREFEKTLSDSFRQSVGANNPFTPAQRAFRDTIKDLYVSKLDQAVPGASVALREANGAYSIANKMFEGARDLEAKLAQTSPLGRDQLSQFILGAAALNSPIAAAKFLIMGAALRGFYNQRGEGALADMASKLAGNGIRAMQNPVKAGAIAAQSFINADRAILYPLNAQRLVSTTPAEYAELTRSVRDMAQNREAIAKQVMTATSGMPPEKQQQVLQKFDRIFQALGDNLPDNIEEPGRISEQARRYTVFARSLLDEAYATQVMANGGPDMQVAADALRAQGEDGQKYIDSLEEQLRTAINNNRDAQQNTDLLAAYKNIKGFSKKAGISVGGGGGRAGGLGRLIHGGAGLRLPKMGGSVKQMSPTQVGSAVNAFSGLGNLKP